MANALVNFDTLIGVVGAFGPRYNPSNSRLALPTLGLLHQATEEATEAAEIAKGEYSNAVIARKTAFASLKPLASSIISALKVAQAPKGVIEDAEAIRRRMNGRRASGSAAPAAAANDDAELPNAPKSVSNAQTGFVNQVKHLADLVRLLKRESSYAPNEPELQIPGIEEYIGQLKAANKLVADLWIVQHNAITKRDAFFHAEMNGLLVIAAAVKEYVKSVFKPKSAEFKQVQAISFPSRKKIDVKEVELAEAA